MDFFLAESNDSSGSGKSLTFKSARCTLLSFGLIGFPRFRSHQAISKDLRSVYTGIVLYIDSTSTENKQEERNPFVVHP